MPPITYGEPIRVRSTCLKAPHFSTAVLLLTGVTTTSAPRNCAQRMPTTSPRSQLPASSPISGRSASPSVDRMASKPYSPAHCRACAMSSCRTASVSIGTKVSARPSESTSAPKASNTSRKRSRATLECSYTPTRQAQKLFGKTGSRQRPQTGARAATQNDWGN